MLDHDRIMSSDLLTAAKNGYYNQVVKLLASGSHDVNAQDKDKATPLYWSASRGHLLICQALINAGCDVNACVKWGSTALHAAADRGHADCLTVLIDSNAEVNVQNQRGDTPLHLAAYRGFKDIVHLLVRAWADPFAKNGQSKTPQQEAQSQQHSGAAAVLQKYMESLGCHAFTSLPESELSRTQSTQDQPPSSVPAASWPRFHTIPRLPENIPPADLSRPHTFPLKVNNLSGTQPGAGESRRLPVGNGTGPENGFGEMSGAKSLNGLYNLQGHKGSLRQHVRSEPQENAEECLNHVDKIVVHKDVYPANNNYLHHSTQLGNGAVANPTSADIVLNSLPPSSQGPSDLRVFMNGQTRLQRSELPLPDVAPPAHLRNMNNAATFVKHEDLTMFAESLQLEVVKLRDSLACREEQVLDLQKLITSLKTHNTSLQQLAASKQNVSEEALALKDAEFSELKKKLADVEKQNLCLQQALVQQQARSNEMSTRREVEMSELKAKVNDMERLNGSLQQLIVTQQDTIKGMLAGKDREISQLKDKVEALSQETASLKQAAKADWQDRSEHTVQSSDNVTAVSRQSVLPAGSLPSQSGTEVINGSCASLDIPGQATKSVIPFCDQPAPQSTYTHNTLTHKTFPASQETSGVVIPKTLQTLIPPQSTNGCDPSRFSPSCKVKASPGASEAQQSSLRTIVASLFQDDLDTGKLDADGREWTVGREFQLLDPKPVNCASDGQRRGSCSLVFSIVHQGRKYMLKMLMNLINLSYEAHSLGRSLDAHLLHRFGAEFHAPLLLHPHPNIVRVRHHYQGDTSHFRSYLPLLVPPSLDVPVEMARRTTFLVMDQYPQTLLSFVALQNEGREGRTSLTERLPEQFVLHLVYQLLSALLYLQQHHVVHRDIKADNVFLDWRLRPVLGDFGFARTLRGYGGQTPTFTDRAQVFAGNGHAWAPELCRWSRTDPDTLPQPMTLEDVYCKSDGFAVSRMFYSLFDNDSGHPFPTSSQQHPHYPDSAIPPLPPPVSPALGHVLRSLVLDDPSRRPTVRQALCSVGVLLCKPAVCLTSAQAAEEFCVSQLLRLSSENAARFTQPETGTLSVAESVTANQNHCLADFLLNFSGMEFWEAYSALRNLGYQ